jgi:hypothetical protein
MEWKIKIDNPIKEWKIKTDKPIHGMEGKY